MFNQLIKQMLVLNMNQQGDAAIKKAIPIFKLDWAQVAQP